MKKVVIVGGGFAGVWGAIAAAELRDTTAADDLEIQLINPRDHLVIRPRLYEADPASMTVSLASVLGPRGVSDVRALVERIDTDKRELKTRDADGNQMMVHYDRLILASGSEMVAPPIERTHIHDIDTVEAAVDLDHHLKGLATMAAHPGRFTLVVVGAGFTGVELAAELVDRMTTIAADTAGGADGIRIVLVERAEVFGSELAPDSRAAIQDVLEKLQIELRPGCTLAGFDGRTATFDDASTMDASTVVWTAGMRANELTGSVPGARDQLGRLAVDQQLRVKGTEAVFAAGDTAAPLDESGHVVSQSCQHAMPQGTCAGHNAVADLLGLPLVDLQTNPYLTCMDLGPAGALLTDGWDRTLVMSGPEVKDLKRTINSDLIYPPIPAG